MIEHGEFSLKADRRNSSGTRLKSNFAWLPQDVFAIGNLDSKELR
jgi:hypothetical protein